MRTCERAGGRIAFIDSASLSTRGTRRLDQARMSTDAQNPDDRKQRMAALSSGRRQVLDRLLSSGSGAAAKPARSDRSIPGDCPVNSAARERVSFAQERMWIHDRLLPDTPLYNETTLMRFRREINPAIIERCLNEIIRRHEALRTAFREGNEQLVQEIAPELAITVPVIDLRHIPAHKSAAELETVAWNEGRRLFDLARGPL